MFCPNCGTENSNGQTLCQKCNYPLLYIPTKRKGGVLIAITIIFSVISLLFCWFPYFVFLLAVPTVIMAIVAFEKRKKTGRKKSSTVALVLALLALIACIIVNPIALDWASTPQFTYEDTVKTAEYVFHSNVKLNNEASYVLNDAVVLSWDEPVVENQPENTKAVKVILDYSAENKFGGMVRDKYYVRFLYNTNTGEYSLVSEGAEDTSVLERGWQ